MMENKQRLDIRKEVREFVREECRKEDAKYKEAFENHFKPAVKYSKELAEELGADKEVVVIAAWLHDIGSIIEGRKNHHLTGKRIAEKKLKELGYPEDKLEKVKKCILNHRGSKEDKNKRDFIEAQIITEADAISAFDDLAGLFNAALVYEGKGLEEARESVIEKLENKWNQLSLEVSKKIIKPKYEAVKLLLNKKSIK